MQEAGFEPIIKPQPLQGVVDLVIIESGSEKSIPLAERVFEEFPFRAFLDEDGCFRASVEKRYGVPAYALLTHEPELTAAIQEELKNNEGEYQLLDADERALCARLRVVYRNIRAGEENIIVALLPNRFLNNKVYDLLCPQGLTREIIHGMGLAVLNPPKAKEAREYNKARRAEDVPELQEYADELSKRQKKE